MYAWPARSGDLTACDFCVGVKGATLLYDTKTLEVLEERIKEVMSSIPQ